MNLLPVADARKLIVESLKPLAIESVALHDALGRVLANDVLAKLNHPPADVSAMDGYAVRAADVAVAPVTLKVVGESAAGHAWRGTLNAGEAVRIFTGAFIPAGADTIVIQENATLKDATVTVNEGAKTGRHIRPGGQDFKSGETVLTAPRRLTPRDIGLAAAANAPRLDVFRKPRVGVLSTGDEIVMPGEHVGPGQIVSANGPGLCALAREHGGVDIHLGVVKDELTALRTAIGRAEPLDLLVTSGGVSVGERDLMRQALQTDDFTLGFHKIAMRPGKPLLFGNLKGLPVLGLPGNPVSAMICAILFLGPAMARLQGLPGIAPATMPVRLGADLPANDAREDYLRATLSRGPDGAYVATPFSKQDSAMVAILAKADALIVRPPEAPSARAGELVQILVLDAR